MLCNSRNKIQTPRGLNFEVADRPEDFDQTLVSVQIRIPIVQSFGAHLFFENYGVALDVRILNVFSRHSHQQKQTAKYVQQMFVNCCGILSRGIPKPRDFPSIRFFTGGIGPRGIPKPAVLSIDMVFTGAIGPVLK